MVVCISAFRAVVFCAVPAYNYQVAYLRFVILPQETFKARTYRKIVSWNLPLVVANLQGCGRIIPHNPAWFAFKEIEGPQRHIKQLLSVSESILHHFGQFYAFFSP